MTVLDRVSGEWELTDARGERLPVRERLVPQMVVRGGEVIEPHRKYLRDVWSGEGLRVAA